MPPTRADPEVEQWGAHRVGWYGHAARAGRGIFLIFERITHNVLGGSGVGV